MAFSHSAVSSILGFGVAVTFGLVSAVAGFFGVDFGFAAVVDAGFFGVGFCLAAVDFDGVGFLTGAFYALCLGFVVCVNAGMSSNENRKMIANDLIKHFI